MHIHSLHIQFNQFNCNVLDFVIIMTHSELKVSNSILLQNDKQCTHYVMYTIVIIQSATALIGIWDIGMTIVV